MNIILLYILTSRIGNRSAWPGPGGIADDNNGLIIFKKKKILIMINTRNNNSVPHKIFGF